MSFKDYLRKCLAFVESLNDRSILAGMGELLDGKQKAWARANLKQEYYFPAQDQVGAREVMDLVLARQQDLVR